MGAHAPLYLRHEPEQQERPFREIGSRKARYGRKARVQHPLRQGRLVGHCGRRSRSRSKKSGQGERARDGDMMRDDQHDVEALAGGERGAGTRTPFLRFPPVEQEIGVPTTAVIISPP